MSTSFKGLCVAVLLTLIMPAHGMFRCGLMTARNAVNKFLTRSAYARLTPAQGTFTTQSSHINPWVKRALIGAALMPGYVGFWTCKKTLNQYDQEEQKTKYIKELYKQRRKYVRTVGKGCPGCPIDIHWPAEETKPIEKMSASLENDFISLTAWF